VSACGHILSCQVVNVAASRDPGVGKAYPILKTPRWNDWMPDPSRVRKGGRLLLSSVPFRLVTPPLQSGVMRPYPVRGV
jgi:hypothetical protein